MTALREEEEEEAAEGRFGLRPVSYLPLQRYVSGRDPIHISNSLAVHGQGVFIGACVRPSGWLALQCSAVQCKGGGWHG